MTQTPDRILETIGELTRDEQLALAARIQQAPVGPAATDEERRLIAKWLDDHEAHPDETVSWEEEEARILARLRATG